MELFLGSPGLVLSADQIMERIWGWDADAEINVVWVHISNLRKKLRSIGANVTIRPAGGWGTFWRKIMINKLRRRFIRIAILSVTVVMLVLCLVVNIANFWSMNSNQKRLLNMISENKGVIPKEPKHGPGHQNEAPLRPGDPPSPPGILP